MITRLENAVIRKYGFEHPITIAVFRFTEILRFGELHTYDISDYEEIPVAIDGHVVLFVHGDTAHCG